MSEKPEPGIFSQLLKHILPKGKQGAGTRYCEKGHPMDLNWTTCPYCDAEKRKSDKSVVRTAMKSDQANAGETTQRSASMEREHTKIGMNLPKEQQRRTRVDTSTEEAPEKKGVSGDRRITGVLVTFSRKYQGELFALYEGRNLIGRDPSCDVSIGSDLEMSGQHAVIFCDPERDELHDEHSTNRTALNGQCIERGTGTNLMDGAMIKAGQTKFEYRKITSSRGEGSSEKEKYIEGGDKSPYRGEPEI